MDINFWIMPIVSGIIGFITNILAIAMILRPFNKKYIFGIPIPFTPGLIHKRKNQISTTLATTINNTLLTRDTVKKAISKNNIEVIIKNFIDTKISTLKDTDAKEYLEKSIGKEAADAIISYTKNEDTLKRNLQTVIDWSKNLIEHDKFDEKVKPVVKSMIKNGLGAMSALIPHEKVYTSVKTSISEMLKDEENLKEKLISFLDEDSSNLLLTAIKNFLDGITDDNTEKFSSQVSKFLAESIEKQMDKAVDKLDFKEAIEEKLLELSEREIYILVMSIAKKELTYISVFGGILGFLMGLLVQLLI